MNGKTFRDIRRFMGLTQREMAKALGYRQKIRVSEHERRTNPVPIPRHIGHAVLLMGEAWWHRDLGGWPPSNYGAAVRKWKRREQ